MVLMNSPKWPYLNQIGEIIEFYSNGDGKLTYVVRTKSTDVGVSPDLCIDARPTLRDNKLNKLLNMKNKEFRINSVITTPSSVTLDQLVNELVEFMESKGYTLGGGIKELNEEGDPI